MVGVEPLYQIGEVAARVGLSPARLRQLEQSGVLPVPRRIAGGGRRLYSEAEIAALRVCLAARLVSRRRRPAA